MTRTLVAVLLSAIVITGPLACADSDGSGYICTPGEVTDCTCDGGRAGRKICSGNGADWSACWCGDGDADADTDADADADADEGLATDEGTEDSPCTPECTGLECGLDPVCGESCGSCETNEICNSGICQCSYVECNGVCCDNGQACSANVSPTAINKTVTEGNNASSETVAVKDNCGADNGYTAIVTSGGAWITAPVTGAGTMEVTFSASTLEPNSYTGTIDVTPDGYATETVTVNLTVDSEPPRVCFERESTGHPERALYCEDKGLCLIQAVGATRGLINPGQHSWCDEDKLHKTEGTYGPGWESSPGPYRLGCRGGGKGLLTKGGLGEYWRGYTGDDLGQTLEGCKNALIGQESKILLEFKCDESPFVLTRSELENYVSLAGGDLHFGAYRGSDAYRWGDIMLCDAQ